MLESKAYTTAGAVPSASARVEMDAAGRRSPGRVLPSATASLLVSRTGKVVACRVIGGR
jgi:hypothetical protein